MSGSLNSFRANIDASFDNLDKHQFHALYEEVLKEKARRLIGEEAANSNRSWNEVNLTADLQLSSGHCHIVASTWNLTDKTRLVDWSGPGRAYDPRIIRGMDYRPGYGPPDPTGVAQVLMPEGSAIPASGNLFFGGW
jgi:hypothetical protein